MLILIFIAMADADGLIVVHDYPWSYSVIDLDILNFDIHFKGVYKLTHY